MTTSRSTATTAIPGTAPTAARSDGPPPRRSEDQTPWYRTWPLTKSQVLQLVVALVAVIGIGAFVGELLTNWWRPSGLLDFDREVAQDLADGRTPELNDLATWAVFPANTLTKIILTAILAGAMLWAWRRWHEALFLATTLIFEATAFIAITTIVQRPRPEVERLLESPVDTSFPSGHVAAATVYAALAVIVFWHTRNVFARAAAVVIVACLPVAVGWGRMYQGMHYFSDVVAGVILGIASLVICAKILGRPTESDPSLAVA